ncbi:MAG TPA: hypothetical protein VGE52_09335, partial [Pirellulales bacterium]
EMVQFMGRGLKAGCGCCRCGTCRPAETIEVVEPSEDYETTPDASASPAIDADPAPAVEGQSARRSAAQEEAVEVLWVDSDGASISPRKN